MTISTNHASLIVLSLVVASAALCFTATATNYWIDFKEGNIGLWKECNKASGVCRTTFSTGKIFTLHQTTATDIKNVFVMSLMSVANVAVVFTLFTLPFIKDGVQILGGIMVAIFVFEVIAMSMYTELYYDTVNSSEAIYGYSFVLGWTASVFTGISIGVLHYFNSKDIIKNRV